MTWKTAIEEEMRKAGIKKSSELADKSGCTRSQITGFLHPDESKRVKVMAMDTCNKIASVFGIKGFTLWSRAGGNGSN